MTILALDTASTICACALYDPLTDRMIASRSEEIGRGHAEHLMGQVEAVLAEAKLSLQDVTALGVCVGPGSFTGIRVGVAAARGFALALGAPVRGVTSLEAIAAEQDLQQPFAVALNAGRQQIYVQAFGAQGEALTAPAMVAAAELSQHLSDSITTLVGNAAALVTEGRFSWIETGASGSIETLARLSAISTLAASPLYLRGADAKVQSGFAVARAPVEAKP